MRTIILILLVMVCISFSYTQVGINENGSVPDNSAMLDVSSTNKGLLIPRMTEAEMSAIVAPANGLIIFNTTENSFYFRTASGWKKLLSEINNHSISDADGDSYLSFRQPSTDDDTLRIFFNGAEKYKISAASIEPVNNGNSVYIGKNTGKNDNGSDNANTAIGYNSMASVISGYQNTAVGYSSLEDLKTGIINVGVGGLAMKSNRAKSRNTAVGYGAMWFADSNSVAFDAYNTAIGTHALRGSFNPANNTGIYNTAVGGRAMNENTSGSCNSAMGYRALYSNSTGYSNTALGVMALYYNTEKNNLVAIGDSALYNNGVGATVSGHGSGNTAIGSKSLYANTTGSYNCAIGLKSLNSNTTGYENSATGWNSLNKNTEGKYNTAYGSRSLFNNTTGNYNVAIGTVTMNSNISGSGNSALGHAALSSNEEGFNNTAIGSEALYKNTTGYLNSAYGNRAGYEITTGTNNIVLGYHAGKNITTGSYNIIVGDNKEAPSATASYQMVIGDSLLLYGDISNKRIGIGTSTPKAILHAHGTGAGGGNVLFTGQRKISGAGDPPSTGAGTRMMWYPDQAAFRSGEVSGTQWDKANLGSYSLASGYNTKAQGTSAVALGYNTTASNDFTTAIGVYTTASGHSSIALGANTSALSFAETVIGRYNTTYTPWNIYDWNALDRLFVIGNGTDDASRSNAMVVLKNGKVGIGVDAPLEQLHTTGTIRFSGLVDGTGTQAVMVNSTGNLSKRTLNTVAFNGYSETDPTWTGNANITDKISRTGNIGIGASATNPTYLLSVGYNGVGLDSPDGNTLTFNTSGTERMCVYNANLGIGCFTPNYKLSIGNNTTGLHNPVSNALSIITNDLERVRIGDNGNVSIGTTSTTNNRLRVISSVSGGTNSTGYFENEHTSGLALRATSNSSDGTILSIQEGSGYSLRCDGYDSYPTGWFVAMIVKGRNVGIGNSNPGQKLDISDGNGRVESGYSWLTNSDIRYKQNITTLENSLQKISKIRGVRYDLKEEDQLVAGKGKHIGFIAQELEKEFPEFVVTEENGYKSVSYDKMTAVLVEAVKEQQSEIDELKKIVQQQQVQISALLKIEQTESASLDKK